VHAVKTLRIYQEEPYFKGLEENFLLADDRGLGKTVVAVEIAKRVMEYLYKPALIIVPLHLKPQWWQEVIDQVPDAIGMDLEASTPLPQPFSSKKPFWIIAHYESVLRHFKTLQKTQWAIVVVDEAHRIKNKDAQRTKAIKQIKARHKIALTGTPYDRNPADIWSILNWLRPDIFKSYWDFFRAHVDYEGDLGGARTIKGVRDPEKFTRAIGPYVIQRSKRDVAPQLPPKIEQYIDVQMTMVQQVLYDRIRELAEIDLARDDGSTMLVPNHLARILRLQQAAVDPRLLGSDENGGKIDWLLQYVNDNPNDTLLVFTRFRDTAIRVAHLLGIPHYIGGSVLENPQDHPRIVATIDAAKEGLNLGHIWNTIFLDCHWSSIAMTQAIDRTERDLQATEPRVIMYLEAVDGHGQPTIDSLVRQTLEAKWSTVDLVNAWLKGDFAGLKGATARDLQSDAVADACAFPALESHKTYLDGRS